jgi:hypothetical protein
MAQRDLLARVEPQLVEPIESATSETQRRIAADAVRFAFSASPRKEGEAETVSALTAGQFGDSPLRQWLEQEAKNAEALSADADIAGDSSGAYGHSQYARALGVSRRALDADPAEAAFGAVYEASFVGHPDTEIADVVRAAVAGR